jgi:hypothetical protein
VAPNRKSDVIKVAVIIVLSSAGASICATKVAAAVTAPASTIDADGDDERTELLYHWQDKKFSNEERHQIFTSSLLVTAIWGGSIIRRRSRQKRNSK